MLTLVHTVVICSIFSVALTTSTTRTSTAADEILPMIPKCFLPEVRLMPEFPFLTQAKQHQRSEYLTIDSTIHINCTVSDSFISKWTVSHCQPICSIPIDLESMVNLKSTKIAIPPRLLEYGFYEFKLTVRMNMSSEFSSSSVTYIEIIPSPLMINLIQYGTSIITIGQDQDLFVDPAKFSSQPDGKSFNETVCRSIS